MSLFARKPSLSLTPAGESLYRAYREMYLMEQNTEMMIEETLTVDLVQMKYSFRPVYIRRFVCYLREAVEHVTGTSLLYGR